MTNSDTVHRSDKKKILNRIGLGKPQGKQEQTMHKTVFIEIFDLRPVLKVFKPLFASPGGGCGGDKQGVSKTMCKLTIS